MKKNDLEIEKSFIDYLVRTIKDEKLSSLEDLTLGGGDVTGQTTALYKDGGLASMFVEKR